jgi:hypothetical protein
VCRMSVQAWGQPHGMMVASVVEHDDHAAVPHSMPQQLREEALERCAIEHLANPTHELTGAQIDRAKTGDGPAGGSMQQNRVLILRGHPQTTTRAVLLKVAFVQAPQLNVGVASQTAEFFYVRNLQRISGSELGARLAEPKVHPPEYPLTLPYTQVHAVMSTKQTIQ